MAKGGRPRKQGRRDAKGKLRPIVMPDRGNDKAAAKKEKYGTDGCDAIGRAYRAGLLGEDGQALMRAGRDIFRTYWSTFGVGRIGCTLGERGGGSGYMGEKRTEDWLNRKLADIGPVGGGSRSAFDQLVLDDHFDDGPDWLDFLIWWSETSPSEPLPETPKAKLDLALEGLRLIVYGERHERELAA